MLITRCRIQQNTDKLTERLSGIPKQSSDGLIINLQPKEKKKKTESSAKISKKEPKANLETVSSEHADKEKESESNQS